MDKENLLVKGLSELGLTITEEQIEKFDKYYEMLACSILCLEKVV